MVLSNVTVSPGNVSSDIESSNYVLWTILPHRNRALLNINVKFVAEIFICQEN